MRVDALTYVDEIGYVRGRLLDTYIRHRPTNKVSYVLGIVNQSPKSLLCVASDIDGGEFEDNLINFDLSPFRYGNFNWDAVSQFVCRRPVRNDWRQGNRTSQLYFSKGVVCRDMWQLMPCIENDYYSLKTCLDMIEDGYESRAFHRDFSINSNYQLFFKGMRAPVGKINYQNGKITLDNKFFWLEETLQEEVG